MGLIYGETLLVSPILLVALPALWGIYGVWIAFPSAQAVMLLLFNLFFMERKNKVNTKMVFYEKKDLRKEE